MLFIQCDQLHFKHIKMKGIFYLLVDETFHLRVFHMQWVTRKRFIFLQTAQNRLSSVKILFHKDTMIHGQAILDIAYKKFQ